MKIYDAFGHARGRYRRRVQQDFQAHFTRQIVVAANVHKNGKLRSCPVCAACTLVPLKTCSTSTPGFDAIKCEIPIKEDMLEAITLLHNVGIVGWESWGWENRDQPSNFSPASSPHKCGLGLLRVSKTKGCTKIERPVSPQVDRFVSIALFLEHLNGLFRPKTERADRIPINDWSKSFNLDKGFY